MKVNRQLGIGLLSVGLSLGSAGPARAQDAPPADEQGKSADAQPAADAQPPAEAQPAAEPQPAADAQPAADGQPAAGAQEGRRGRESRDGARRGMDPQRMLERMQASFGDLNLSDEQKTKIQAIVDKAKPQLEAAVKETQGQQPRERMAKFRETMQPIREEIMGVLDETQRQRLREKTQSDRAARGERRGGGPPTIERLKETLAKLELNDDQKKQVDALLVDAEKQFAAIRAEADKAPPAAGTGGEARAKFGELMQSNRRRLNEILTPEQQQKLRELSPRRAGGRGERGGQGDAPAPTETPREPL